MLGDASRWLRPRIQQAAAQLTAQQRSVLEWGSTAFSAAAHQRPAQQHSPFWLPSFAETLLCHLHRIPLNAGQRKLLQDEELLSAARTVTDAVMLAKSSGAASADASASSAASAGTKATSELQQGVLGGTRRRTPAAYIAPAQGSDAPFVPAQPTRHPEHCTGAVFEACCTLPITFASHSTKVTSPLTCTVRAGHTLGALAGGTATQPKHTHVATRVATRLRCCCLLRHLRLGAHFIVNTARADSLASCCPWGCKHVPGLAHTPNPQPGIMR